MKDAAVSEALIEQELQGNTTARQGGEMPETLDVLSCIDFDCEFGRFRLSLYVDD